jgi:hypothetical protein
MDLDPGGPNPDPQHCCKERDNDKMEGGIFVEFLLDFIQHCSSAVLQISLCQRMLGSNPGLLRHWELQSDALTTWLNFMDERYYFLFTSQHCKKIFLTSDFHNLMGFTSKDMANNIKSF